LDCVEPSDILKLLSFADTDILSVRPLHETLHDLGDWIVHLRDKFESQFHP
jgi:hypothetical protein